MAIPNINGITTIRKNLSQRITTLGLCAISNVANIIIPKKKVNANPINIINIPNIFLILLSRI